MTSGRPVARIGWLFVLVCNVVLGRRDGSAGSTVFGISNAVDAHIDHGEMVAGAGRQLLAATEDNVTVYSGGFIGGWDTDTKGYGAANSSQTTISYGYDRGNGVCATLPSPGAWVAFSCSNCTASPFSLNNTAGFAYALAEVELDASGKFGSPVVSAAKPTHVNVSLFEDIGGELYSTCTMFLGKANLGPFRDSALYEYSTLFQNFNNDPKCREAFKTATAIGFFSQSTNVSVCMDSLKLLPSTVQLEDEIQALPGYPSQWRNCWQNYPRSMTIEGNYTWPALPPFMLSNITSKTLARSMIAAPRIDVPYRHYLAAVNESCSVINSPYLAEISTCSKTTPNGYGSAEFNHGSACCYNTTGKDNDTLPELLMTICDTLLLGRKNPDSGDLHGQRCNGIQYIHNENIAYFLAQNEGSGVLAPLTGGGDQEICNHPEAVMWYTRGASPEWVPEPNNLDYSSIYDSGLQKGWNLDTWSSNLTVDSMSYITADNANGSAMCFSMPTLQDTPRFICQDCPSNVTYGIESPYLLNRTSGLGMVISSAEYDSSTGFAINGTWAAPKLSLLREDGTSVCTGYPVPDPQGSGSVGNFTEATFLFQNNIDCIKMLNETASLEFSLPDGSGGRGMCLDRLELLPSALNKSSAQAGTAGELNVVNFGAGSSIPNCEAVGDTPKWFVTPQPTNENGNFTVFGQNPKMSHNASASGFNFVLRQNWALQANDAGNLLKMLLPANGTDCSSADTEDTQQVKKCAKDAKVCCFNTTAVNYQDNKGNASLPDKLAQICNQLSQPLPSGLPRLCQGWIYDYITGVATFLGQTNGLDLQRDTLEGAVCNRPSADMWLLESATLGTEDTRPVALGPASPHHVDVGTVLGIVLGVLTPAAGVVGWLAVTYRYRLSKRKLVVEVVNRLKVDNIADSSAIAVSPAFRTPRIFVSASRQLAAAGLLRATSTTPSNPGTASQGLTELTAGMKHSAADMVQVCLRQWDGPLGLYAGSAPFGGRRGIWRGEFANVRCAVLVLAMHRVNKARLSNSTSSVSLLHAWQRSKTSKERQKVTKEIAQMLNQITGAEAQNLPDKDPETM